MEQQQNNLIEQVFKKIDDEKLTPIARWHFTLKNNSFWALWGASVLLGACAIAGVIFSFSRFGWQYRYITHETSFGFLFDALPIFWLISFIGMIAFGYYNLRHTSKGYKFSFVLILLVSLFLSFILGTLLFAIGFGKKLDNLRRPLSFAPPAMVLEEKIWTNDQKGLLTGIVKSIDKQNNTVVLTLPSNIEKVVNISQLPEVILPNIFEGAHIKIIGTIKETEFYACIILPSERPYKMLPPPKEVFERNSLEERNSICKDVRPYQQYKRVFIRN